MTLSENVSIEKRLSFVFVFFGRRFFSFFVKLEQKSALADRMSLMTITKKLNKNVLKNGLTYYFQLDKFNEQTQHARTKSTGML